MLKNWLNSLGILKKKTKSTWISDLLHQSNLQFPNLDEYISIYQKPSAGKHLAKNSSSINLETRLYYLCKPPKSVDDPQKWMQLLLDYDLHLSDNFLMDLIELLVGKYAYATQLATAYQEDLAKHKASISLNQFKQIQEISIQHLIRYFKENGLVSHFFAPLIEKVDQLEDQTYALLCQYLESQYTQYPFPKNLPPIEFYDIQTGDHIDDARFVRAVWSALVYLRLHDMLPEEIREEKIPPQYESFLYTSFCGQGTFKHLDVKTRWQAGFLYKKYALESESQEHSIIKKQLDELARK